ncbi:MAG: cell division protein ZapA [Clostridia bacterium]|nr:cell division protein ZapA [Clostridia bacterium]
MKQKYSITVADMELNIISDASPDEVENIVGILDRRMREVNLKSPRCTKNEAAILCALSYCSERIAMQEAFKKVEKDAFRFAGENEKLKRTIEQMQEEIDRLRKDAAVMRSILDHAAANAAAAPAAEPATAPRRPSGKTESAKEAPAPIPVGDQLSAFDDLPAMADTPADTADADGSARSDAAGEVSAATNDTVKNDKPKTKNRVGTMFDLLTFSDV